MTHRGLYGKFPTGIHLGAINEKVGPLQLDTSESQGFGSYADAEGHRQWLEHYAKNLSGIINHLSDENPLRHVPLLMFVVPAPDAPPQEKGYALYNFPTQTLTDTFDRPIPNIMIGARMPREQILTLRDLVIASPDALEAYLKALVPGLAELDDRQHPTSLYVVDGTTAYPAIDKFSKRDLYTPLSDEASKAFNELLSASPSGEPGLRLVRS